MGFLRAAALVVIIGCTPPTATSPTPTPASPTPTQSTSASATLRPSTTRTPIATVGPGTYTNLAFAYRVELPAGWRYSVCQSATDIGPVSSISEGFTSATVADEAITDVGPVHPIVHVRVVGNPTGQTATQWLAGGGPLLATDSKFEPATVDGRDGARILTAAGELTGLVTIARGRIYAITALASDNKVSAAAARIVSSLHVLDDAELAAARATLATAEPTAPRTAEAVADTLARGFAQKDTATLATVAWACLTRGFQNSGGSSASTTRVLDELRQELAGGVTITVAPRPVTATADYASVESTLAETGKAPRRLVLNMLRRGETWYWMGWIDFRS